MAIPSMFEEAVMDERQRDAQILALFLNIHPNLKTEKEIHHVNALLQAHRPAVFSAIILALKAEKHGSVTFREALRAQIPQLVA